MTGVANQPEPAWYQDETSLLGLARQSRVATRAPVIPGYEGLTELRRGGQGVVYEGLQSSTRQRVAVKVLLGGTLAGSAAQRRFEREAELAASLRHPNIVRVYDRGVTDQGLAFLVMEFVEGRPLDELIREARPADAREAAARVRARVELFAGVCEAVAHAHQRGVIHRDLKPSNVRVDGAGRPKVLDFGLAKAEGSESLEVTASGQFLGSLPWASPEQAQGGADGADVRSDVYSLGVILYQLLSGRFPYDVSGSISTTLSNIRGTDPASLRGASPGVDEDLQTIAFKCLSKEPDRRYQTAEELTGDVRSWLAGEPIRARRDSAWYAVRKTARRHRTAAVVAGAALAASLGAAGWLSVLYSRASAAEQRATTALDSAQRQVEEKSAAVEFLRDMLESGSAVRDGREVRVMDVVDKAAENLRQGELPEPTRAVLCTTLGDSYISLSAFEKAAPLVQQAYDLQAKAKGPGHVDTVQALTRLSYLRYLEGNQDESLRLARDAAERNARLTPEEQFTTRAVEGLSLALHGAGDLAGSERAAREALALYHTLGKDNEPRALEALANLGVVLRQQSKLQEAKEVYEDALRRTESRTDMGANHRDHLLLNYGSLLQDLGRLDEAEATYRRAAEGMQKMLGPDHPDTMTAASNLSTLLIQRGKPEQARDLMRGVVEQSTKRYGEESAITLTYMHNLAKATQDAGDLDAAEALTRRTVELRVRVLGPEHPHTLITMTNLAAILKLRGQTAEAAALDERILEARLRTLGETNTGTLISMNNVALTRANAGDTASALDLSARAVAGAEKTLGAAHWMTALFRGGRGKVLDKAGQPAEAEKELLASYEGLKTGLGPTDKRVKAGAKTLADFYAAHGDAAQATAWESQSK